MRVAAQVTLTAIERRRLETWASARSTTVRLVERSKIVLMACAGMTNQAITKALGIDQNTAGRWRNRFVKERVKGIEKERPRGGITAARTPSDKRSCGLGLLRQRRRRRRRTRRTGRHARWPGRWGRRTALSTVCGSRMV